MKTYDYMYNWTKEHFGMRKWSEETYEALTKSLISLYKITEDILNDEGFQETLEDYRIFDTEEELFDWIYDDISDYTPWEIRCAPLPRDMENCFKFGDEWFFWFIQEV